MRRGWLHGRGQPAQPRLRGLGQRRAAKRVEQRVARVREGVMDVTRTVGVALTAPQDARPYGAIMLRGPDHIEKLDVRRWSGQPVAAGSSRLGNHQVGPDQVRHHLGQEPRRDLHLSGDAARAERAVGVRRRECDGRTHGIIPPPRQLESHCGPSMPRAAGKAVRTQVGSARHLGRPVWRHLPCPSWDPCVAST